MRVSIWKGGTYGIRIGSSDMSTFKRTWKSVVIDIAGQPYPFSLSKAFWSTCPEIRSGEIAACIRRNGLTSWPRYHPPQMNLLPLGGNRFKLSTQ